MPSPRGLSGVLKIDNTTKTTDSVKTHEDTTLNYKIIFVFTKKPKMCSQICCELRDMPKCIIVFLVLVYSQKLD